jgi:hypothetical protein
MKLNLNLLFSNKAAAQQGAASGTPVGPLSLVVSLIF